jgi:HlyD family secretion protein
MKRIIITSLIVLFISAAGGTTYFLYRKKIKPPQVYTLDSVVVKDIVSKSIATGTIEPRREINIKPQISGNIEKLYKKAGDYVKVGDVIATIKIIPNMQQINNAETNVNTARISYEIAKIEYERQLKLYQDKVIAQSDFLPFEQDYKIKKEQLEAAENALQLAKKGSADRISKPTTIVRSLVEGTLLDVPVKEGSVVIEANNFNEGTTIATVANMKDLIFKGKVVESEVGKLKIGMPLILDIGAILNEKFDAKLEFISSKGVEEKGAVKFEIRAGLTHVNDRSDIRAGYSASADIILKKLEGVLAVKEKNVEFGHDTAFVYKFIKKDEFEKIQVKLGLSDDSYVQVIEGLKLGDKLKEL